jgi:hypothetical protein
MKCAAWLLLLGGAAAWAGEPVDVCYNYGCLSEDQVLYSDAQLRRVGELLGDASSALHERALLGVAIGWMLGWAGQQTPVSADRGGNYADDGVYGRMDCVDHATTTTRLLRLMERRGWLRFHRVLEPARRTRLWLLEHYSAQIEEIVEIVEIAPADDEPELPRFVVDSWFFDNGQPAAVMPLENWLAGEGPDVEEHQDER